MNTNNKTEKIDIIMFNMSTFYDWDHGIVNRNYNILNTLAKNDLVNKIVAVDFLPIGLKKTIRHYWQNIILETKSSEIVYGDLTSECYKRSDKIYIYTTVDSFFSMHKVGQELKRIEKILNLKNIVFWSFNPLFVEFIGKLNEKMTIFDTVDKWSEHKSYRKLMKEKKILRNYQTIANTANLIFTVSEELIDFYKNELGRPKDVYWVPNGVDFDHFNNSDKIEIENKLTKLDKPIIGYLGTIEERVNLDIVEQIALDHKDKIIALCGPIWPNYKDEVEKKLNKFENIIFTGRIKYDESPSYVNKFTVGIIPHQINEFIKSTNPMKMYEYLACGLPIVSTSGSGINMFKDYVYVSNDKVEFSNLINTAINEDSPQKQSQRRNEVKSHSWNARVNKMIDLIEQKL